MKLYFANGNDMVMVKRYPCRYGQKKYMVGQVFKHMLCSA